MRRNYSRIIIFFILIIYMLSVSTAFAMNKPTKPKVLEVTPKKVVVAYFVPDKKGLNVQGSTSQGAAKTQVVVKQAKAVTFDQFNDPTRGEEIAVITTTKGVIKVKLLSQYAPKTVELFKSKVYSGFYNGLNINRIIPNSTIQGGVSTPLNSSAISDGGKTLDDFTNEVRNFRGAVATVGGDQGNSLEQFIIVQADVNSIAKDPLNYMLNSGEKLFPKEVINKYKKVGGAPWLDYHNIVFGQVIQSQGQGMKIVDKISQSGIDESNKPKKEIKITKIEIVNYK